MATMHYSPWNHVAKATSVSSGLFLSFRWRKIPNTITLQGNLTKTPLSPLPPKNLQKIEWEIIQYARILIAKTKLQGEKPKQPYR